MGKIYNAELFAKRLSKLMQDNGDSTYSLGEYLDMNPSTISKYTTGVSVPKSIIIEKNEKVGGLCRTKKFGEFITDIGPHRFFSKNQYLYNMIEDLLGEHWIKVNRYTRFYIDYKFYNYANKYQLYPLYIKE
jgi:transcriptional regulator with XRE-family HTH domain